MATDYSQNIDIVGKKELGWVVPRVLEPGADVDASGWQDTKVDTHRIDWKQPDGTPYALEGDDVAQRRAPTPPRCRRRQILDPDLVPVRRARVLVGLRQRLRLPAAGRPQRRHRAAGAQGRARGHAGDADVQVPLGHRVGLRLRLRADHHRQRQDVHVARVRQGLHDAGQPERQRQRLPVSQFGNGITGSSGSYAAGTQTVDRVAGTYPDAPFLDDEYDLSDLAGKASVLRLTYATDPGLARAGLVRRRPRRSRPATASSTPRTSSPRPTRRSTTAAAARACRPRRPARTAGRASRPPTARRPSTRT